jgi:hypothetical protein
MLDNTITVTINSVAKALLRIREDANGSLYRLKNTTEQIELRVRHSSSSQDGFTMNRHNVNWEHIVYATDTTPAYKWTTSITVSERDGSDPDYLGLTMAGLQAALSSEWDNIAIGEV